MTTFSFSAFAIVGYVWNSNKKGGPMQIMYDWKHEQQGHVLLFWPLYYYIVFLTWTLRPTWKQWRVFLIIAIGWSCFIVKHKWAMVMLISSNGLWVQHRFWPTNNELEVGHEWKRGFHRNEVPLSTSQRFQQKSMTLNYETS